MNNNFVTPILKNSTKQQNINMSRFITCALQISTFLDLGLKKNEISNLEKHSLNW